ncbi:HET-domain-containing protein [Tothia fuscella]|uniref:HET-domain-containing protein n=1 Tax=Tothia fuscella TaxID=1048955 RepID=A0A9P4NU65_9PEZI|nr:HET-domain-containing protein [Tothia fuscella]
METRIYEVFGVAGHYAKDGSDISTWISSRPQNVRPDSSATFRLARKWMETCSNTHSVCSRPEKFMPTRVLDVGVQHMPISVRLVTCSDLQETYSYAALSYVWGSGGRLPRQATTWATFRERPKMKLDFSNLPATLRDAIIVTRCLKIRYLWVDALCIIQDSPEDKTYELAKMPEIYKNAQMTITAALGPTFEAGSLTRPKPSHVDSTTLFKIHGRNLFGRHGTVHLSPIRLGNTFRSSVPVEPTSMRAWTMQEHMLSCRVLIYGSQQLRFVCRSMQRTDGGNIAASLEAPGLIRLKHDKKNGPNSDKPLKAPSLLPWDKLVKEYTKRNLTNPEDKLVAFAGITSEYNKLAPDTYLAGIRRSQLVHELMWRCVAGDRKPRPEYRAPSWSWASVDSPVICSSFHRGDINSTTLRLISAFCEPKIPSLPYGEVSAGALTCEAYTQRASITASGRHFLLRSDSSKVWPVATFDTILEDGALEGTFQNVVCFVVSSTKPN